MQCHAISNLLMGTVIKPLCVCWTPLLFPAIKAISSSIVAKICIRESTYTYSKSIYRYCAFYGSNLDSLCANIVVPLGTFVLRLLLGVYSPTSLTGQTVRRNKR